MARVDVTITTMSSITIELYDALKSAGVSEEQARKAAEAVSGSREATTKSDLVAFGIRLIKWLVGIFGAQTVIILTLISWMLSAQ